MFVIVQDGKNELHACGDSGPPVGLQRYPQPPYNVGVLNQPTNLASGGNTFGTVDFGNTLGERFNVELPSLGNQPASPISVLKRAGILDDVIFFITWLVRFDVTARFASSNPVRRSRCDSTRSPTRSTRS